MSNFDDLVAMAPDPPAGKEGDITLMPDECRTLISWLCTPIGELRLGSTVFLGTGSSGKRSVIFRPAAPEGGKPRPDAPQGPFDWEFTVWPSGDQGMALNDLCQAMSGSTGYLTMTEAQFGIFRRRLETDHGLALHGVTRRPHADPEEVA